MSIPGAAATPASEAVSPRLTRAPHIRTRWTRRLRGAIPWGVLGLVALYTAAIFVRPSLKTSWYSPDSRILIEAVSFCIAMFAAVTLRIPTGRDAERSRNAFSAALVAIAASYGAMIVGFILIVSPSMLHDVIGLYTWIVTRYLAGLLFIAAAVGRPSLSVRTFLLWAAAILIATVVFCGALAEVLPTPVMHTSDGLAVLTFSTVEQIVISGIPALMFAVGAVLAWRVHRRTVTPIYGWLALALSVQTISKVHEMLYSATFGPLITSADLLRLLMLALLLAGALVTVHHLATERAAALEAQDRDMVALEEVSASLARFADQEQAFRSIVVHELATPVAAIRAFAHVLANPSHSDTRRAREGVIDASRRLQELIDRMDDLRHIEGDDFTVDLQPVHLEPLLRELATFVDALPGDHRVALHCGDFRARVDPLRLGQALRNLATNAARYGPPGSTIVVTCEAVDDDRVRVVVTDAGPGITPQDRQRVLHKYDRGSKQPGTSGAGLGLYIADRIAVAHGGRLLIDSGPGGIGTSVSLELRRST